MENTSEHSLPNGLKVILAENHKAAVVTFQVWYRAGARKDGWGKTGLAHLFEHLMFKGTERISGEEFTQRIRELGGSYNAFTSHDFAAYFENVTADHVEVPIRLEADRMEHLKFTQEEFDTEKMVVMEERRLRSQDRPQRFLAEQTMAAAFQAQPYHWPVVGWMEDLKRITYQDALRFYDRYYDPSNALIVVVGDFQPDQVLGIISEHFGALSSQRKPPEFRYEDPPQRGERRVLVSREAALPYLILGYHVPNLPHPDAYVLEVISALLSSGKSSRLYERIVRGRSLAISAGSEYSLLSLDPPLFHIYGQPLPEKDIGELESALLEEIRDLQQKPVKDRELQKAKNQLESAFVFRQDSTFFQGMLLARYEIVSAWEDRGKYLPAVSKVSSEEITRVAKKYFQPHNRTVGVLEPVKEASPRGQEGSTATGNQG